MSSSRKSDYRKDAEDAGLRYVTDDEPGITREGSAQEGFTYKWPSGEHVEDEATRERIDALAIPPAWTDVWIAKDADAHLQATGRDDADRKQYLYHEKFREAREKAKYDRIIGFGEALPGIRERVEEDLARPGLPREKVLAIAVRILDETGMRVGNKAYTREHGSHGLTTLRDEHAKFEDGRKVKFRYAGKGGKEHEVEVDDPELARLVRDCRDVPGQELFQYVDEDGERHVIDSGEVNAYIQDATGGAFTAKDFRTWNATVLAAERLKGLDAEDSERKRASQLKSAVEEVAEELGNTYSVTRSSYVHPDVLETWEDEGELDLPRSRRKGLTSEEAQTLRFLEED